MKWIEQTNERKRIILDEASARLKALNNAVEKDLWVTVALKAIFNTAFAKDIVFKGGTSLSKSWKLIQRFSEDIDLAINREALGFGGEISNFKIKQLKKKGAKFTSTEFMEAVEQEMYNLGVEKGTIKIYAEPILANRPDTDPQAIYIDYPTVLEANEYLLPPVKIEISVRSLIEPAHEREVSSLIDEAIPGNGYAGDPFTVQAIDPRITFLEKVFLLHEEFTKPRDKIRTVRMSRHLHDLEKTMDTDFGRAAISDQKLYDQLIAHRRHFIRQQNVSYDLHGRETLQFLPVGDLLQQYGEDYELMKANMFRGVTTSFKEVIERLTELQNRIKQINASA
ncbi:MAG: nucleotidyl transferase AbiEii/AbiGii toxin family protein [Chitinophaga sp.]|jgi:hypothetical protein|nr:nucleotidyl transferase AbiEii/AbiGii toxin family protein [Chitinophaga sp.]